MAEYDINLREYWRILKKRKPIVILTAIVLAIFSTFLAVFQAPTPLYTSVCSIKFEKETTIEGLYARTISWSGGDDLETQLSLITSYSIIQEVAKQLGLVQDKEIRKDVPLTPKVIGLVENLQSKVKVSRESFTNILNIEATDSDPVFAQRLATSVAVTYKKIHADQASRRTREAVKYIDEQLIKVRQNLQNAEEEFNQFSQKNQLLSIDLQSENLLLQKKEIRDWIRELKEAKEELKNVLIRVEGFIKDPSGVDRNFYASKASTQYQKTNDALVGLLLKKDTLLEDYTSRHPDVIAVSQKAIEHARKMGILLKLQISDMEKKEVDLEGELENVAMKTELLMEKKLEYNRLKRNVNSFDEMTALLEQKNQEALIRKAEKPEEVTIVKPALVTTIPINPPKTATTGVMGAIIGLVIGLVIAFIVETFDTSLGAIEDVEETLGAQVLGVIPEVDAKDLHESLKDKYPERIDDDQSMSKTMNLVAHFAPKTMIAESFRALRTNIQFKKAESNMKTIAITSTSPQEGKTLVSANLSISLAQSGMKTLLVGSDLRKPMIAKHFGLEMTPGLTDILIGNFSMQETVKTITDIIMGKISLEEVMITPGMDNLHIITSGAIPPNPAELIESNRLNQFIEEANKEYDIVLFDSSPILSTADAAILGKNVDGVLLVYRVGVVSRGLLKRSATQLGQVNCNIIGVVLNSMRPDISPDFQNFKYYKYYYAESEEDSEKKEGGIRRALSFLGRKKERDDGSVPEVLPESADEATEDTKAERPSVSIKWALIVLALLFLAGGVIWQNGLLDPLSIMNGSKPTNKDESLPLIKKRLIIPPVEDGLEDPPALSNRSISMEMPRSQKNMPVSKSQPAPDYQQMGLSYRYSLYLGSFRALERARKTIAHYREKGLSTYWVKVELGSKGTWYRVYAGYFKGPEQAQRFLKENELSEAEIKKTVYANLIGLYESPDKLKDRVLSLKKHGYSHYVIEDKEGRSLLFVGAFITKAGAEKQYHDLKSKGIQNQVVKR